MLNGWPLEMPLGNARDSRGVRFRFAPWPLHGVILGASQRGKTEFLICAFLAWVLLCGYGGLFIDPSATAVARIKRFLTGQGVSERVREISRGAEQPQLSYNPLDVTGLTPYQVYDRLNAFIDLFTVVQGWNFKANSRAINLTTQTVKALMELNMRLPAELQCTVFQIPRFLTDEKWQTVVRSAIPGRLHSFWEHEYQDMKRDAVGPITNLIRLIREDPALAALLGSSRSNFNLRKAMDERQIVLANIGKPGVSHSFLANLLLHDLVAAFWSRGENSGLPPFMFGLDEAQTVDGAASGSIADALEGVAKFGGMGFVLTQNFLRLARDTQLALLTNRRLLICFTLELEAARMAAKDWTRGGKPTVEATVLPNLPKHEAIVDTEGASGERSQFKIHTLPVTEVYKAYLNDRGVPALQRQIDSHNRTSDEVAAELDTLEERIAAHLRSVGAVSQEAERQVLTLKTNA